MMKKKLKLFEMFEKFEGIDLKPISFCLMSVVFLVFALIEIKMFYKYAAIIGNIRRVVTIVSIRCFVLFLIAALCFWIIVRVKPDKEKNDTIKIKKIKIPSITFMLAFVTAACSIIIFISSLQFWMPGTGLVSLEPIKEYTQEDLKHVSIHEASHAVLGEKLYPKKLNNIKVLTKNDIITIYSYYYIGQNDLPGAVTQFDYTTGWKKYKQDIINAIVCSLGGVAGDDFFNNGSFIAGARGDISSVQENIKKYVNEGYSKFGPISWDLLTDQQKAEISKELTDYCYAEAKKMISENKNIIEKVAIAVLEAKEYNLSGDEIRKIMQQ